MNTLEQLYYQTESMVRADEALRAMSGGWRLAALTGHVLMEWAAFALGEWERERGSLNKFHTNHGTSETIKCINTRHKLFTLAQASYAFRILDIRSACT